jgi:hypothetical protein
MVTDSRGEAIARLVAVPVGGHDLVYIGISAAVGLDVFGRPALERGGAVDQGVV